ncbi:unnamed protein product [Paramecium primaurelia]|uniref:Protein kinase domain-containing protein n=1 Tax=Paramecium primaurelia TaxID=5886 RepID=A0A8S1N6S7_PARPR|nr:unnamed protein product [Paramecium primaurelia]
MIEAPNDKFPQRKFAIQTALGEGSQGKVYLVKAINWGINDQKQYAIKQQTNINENEQAIINNIINYQNEQSNPPSQIIKTYEIFIQNNKVFIVMETGEMDLYKYLTSKQQINLEEKIRIMKQLSLSIQFFHENLKLVHRDIKPENFIKVGNEFKLIDFGLAKKPQDRFMTQNVGTPFFQAPEQIQGQNNYTFSVDIWSLGCVFFEILKGQTLFNANNIQQVQNLVLNYHQKYLEDQLNQNDIPQNLKSLLIQMIQYNPKDRLTIQENTLIIQLLIRIQIRI